MEIVAKRGHYFKVVDMPRPLKALNGKVGITLEDEDGFRFTTESRNVKIIQDSYMPDKFKLCSGVATTQI